MNYFKIPFQGQNISVINILGLAGGLATCLLIMLYIADETSYVKHHKDLDRIFRVASVTGKGETWSAGPAPMAAGLQSDLPEVLQAARLLEIQQFIQSTFRKI